MQCKEFLDIRVRENGVLRERSLDFEVALNQTIDSSLHRCRHAMSVLHDLCRFLEAESQQQFGEEETLLYAAVEYKLPRLRSLLAELRQEHDVFRQLLEDFRCELVHFNVSGQLRNLLGLGAELVSNLRHHVDREEYELHSVVLQEFEDEDLPGLGLSV